MSIGFHFTATGGYQMGMQGIRYYLKLDLGNGYKAYMFYRKTVPLFYIDMKIQIRDEPKVKEFLRAQRFQPTPTPR